MLGGTAILGCPLFSQSFEGHDIGDSGQQPENRAQPPSRRMPGGTAILGCPLFPQSFLGARYRRFRAAAGKSCPTAVPSHAGWDSHSWLSAFSPVLSSGPISDIPCSLRKAVPNRGPIACRVGQPFFAALFFPISFFYLSILHSC